MHHPLEKFSYCPVCGSKRFEINNFKSKKCEDCGFTYYANPCSATVAFIRNDKGELLVATRGKEPAKDTFDLPGGFVDMEETVEEAMCREIMEETGMTVREMKYRFSIPNHYLYSGMVIHTLDMFYEVQVVDDKQPMANDDVAKLQWIPLEQVNPKDFGLHSISQGVARYLSESLRK